MVETEEEKQIFLNLYEESFVEMGYHMVDGKHVEERADNYLLINNEGEYSGTLQVMEFKPEKGYSTFEELEAFMQFDFIKNDIENVLEMDKITVSSKYRGGETLFHAMLLILQIVNERNTKYILCELNPRLAANSKKFYGFNLLELGIRRSSYGYDLVPVIIDVMQNRVILEKLIDRQMMQL